MKKEKKKSCEKNMKNIKKIIYQLPLNLEHHLQYQLKHPLLSINLDFFQFLITISLEYLMKLENIWLKTKFLLTKILLNGGQVKKLNIQYYQKWLEYI